MGRAGLQKPKSKPNPAQGGLGHLKAHNGSSWAFFDGPGGPPTALEPAGQMMRPTWYSDHAYAAGGTLSGSGSVGLLDTALPVVPMGETLPKFLVESLDSYEIIESKIINDRETERSRGFIFVTFNNEKAIRDAIEGINGQNLDGRNITVNEALSRGSGVVVAVTKVTAMKDMAVFATEEAVIVKAVGIASR
ncbi:hypothetical protein L3X38_018847 [Prunus dulcis]|uniref:RRM domain-containing protein n=1 Tax=Prunus dulcis TaxID=3755 RepID=A0AAD4W9T1_PRUDU|nr:hypothetical protein L3X38_018847 [Prunus dulcis]